MALTGSVPKSNAVCSTFQTFMQQHAPPSKRPSVAVIGPPASGKTTVMLDLIKNLYGQRNTVILDYYAEALGTAYPDLDCALINFSEPFSERLVMDIYQGIRRGTGYRAQIFTTLNDTDASHLTIMNYDVTIRTEHIGNEYTAQVVANRFGPRSRAYTV